MTEEQRKQCEEIINSYEEKYKKDSEEISKLSIPIAEGLQKKYEIYSFPIYNEYTSTIRRMFKYFYGIKESKFQTKEAYIKYLEFLEKSNNKVAENIIELAVSLSEVFNENITKEEAEKLLFINYDEKENNLNKYYIASDKFINIINLYRDENKIYGISIGECVNIKNIGWAIANRFDIKNNDLVSKKFIVKNLEFHGRGIIEYQIAIFMKGLDGEVKIENDNYKIVKIAKKATSVLKIISLGIRYNDKFTIYCYGENKEKNLKEIEKYFKSIEIYPIEENEK